MNNKRLGASPLVMDLLKQRKLTMGFSSLNDVVLYTMKIQNVLAELANSGAGPELTYRCLKILLKKREFGKSSSAIKVLNYIKSLATEHDGDDETLSN